MTARAALVVASVLAAAGGCGGDDDAAVPAVPHRADPVVVTVAVGSGPAPGAVATGFVAGRARVVTVAHVLDEPGVVHVRLPSSAQRRARVVRVDRGLDLALLAVPGLPGARAVARRADGAVRVLALRGRATRAVRATIRRHITARIAPTPGGRPTARPAVELAATIAPGDSGAPVVDARGDVAAVVFARSERRADTAYAVDAPALAAFLQR